MTALWVSLLLGAAVLLLAVYALRQRGRAAAEAAYVDDLERLVEARAAELTLLAQLSGSFASVLELDVLKLAMVGRVLKEGLRSTDIACRYGGDEFLILLPETSLAGAVHAVENLRRRIATTPIDVPGGPLSVSASVGVTAVEATEEDPSAPIARADAAMYDAKRAGRNHVSVKTGPEPEPPASARL